MTPWLRTVGATGVGVALRVGAVLGTGVVLGTGAVVMPYASAVTPFGTPVAHAAEEAPGAGLVSRSPSPSPSPSTSSSSSSSFSSFSPSSSSPSDEPSRAGSRAGEGRERPGRRETAERAPHDRGERGRGDPREADDGGPGTVPRRPDADAGIERPDTAGVGGLPDAPRERDGDTVSRAPGSGDTVPRAPTSQGAVPVPSAPSQAPAPGTVTSAERSVEPALRILPLGSGLVLIGLGLGLAFVALRMRQGGLS